MWLCVKWRTCLTARPNQLTQRILSLVLLQIHYRIRENDVGQQNGLQNRHFKLFSLISSNRFHKPPSRIKKQQQPQLTGVWNCRRLHTILQEMIDFVTKKHKNNNKTNTTTTTTTHTHAHTQKTTTKPARKKLKPVLNVTNCFDPKRHMAEAMPIFPIFRSWESRKYLAFPALASLQEIKHRFLMSRSVFNKSA